MKVVFVDRDGVLNVDRSDYVKSWDEFEFLPGVHEALASLADNGLPVVIVTNQSAINRGIISVETLHDIHSRMLESIQRHGGRILKVAYCPHRPDERCDCRKPRPGLLISVAAELGADLSSSYFVGDTLTDMAAGEAAGCETILVLTGHGQQQILSAEAPGQDGFCVATDLKSAVQMILEKENLAKSPIA